MNYINTMKTNVALGDLMQAYFLSWFNDFLTVERFAEYHKLDVANAAKLIEIGRDIHEARVLELKQMEAVK